MNILDATISHVLTQLTYRWFSHNSLIELASSKYLKDFSLCEWRQYISYHTKQRSKPWASILSNKLDGQVDIVLKEIETILTLPEPIVYLSLCDPCYPEPLRRIAQPPYGLFTIGDDGLFDRPSIAIVGSRKSSSTARVVARSMAARLSSLGASIVSGGAIGCDAAAHYGAIDSRLQPCPTIVVMAGGLDKLYPRYNHQLFNSLLKKNALFVSERLPGTQPRPMDFPIRNRIIAGLSNRIILAQAAMKSGAMNTINIGLAEGRDVLVFDNQEDDIRFSGNRSLLDDGAEGFNNIADYFAP